MVFYIGVIYCKYDIISAHMEGGQFGSLELLEMRVKQQWTHLYYRCLKNLLKAPFQLISLNLEVVTFDKDTTSS